MTARTVTTAHLGVMASLGLILAQGAQAQESTKAADSSKSVLEEIIVTAQKREQRLLDVPISMSVLSGDELDRSTVQGVTEALSRVAGVTVDELVQGGGTQVAMRGVSSPSGSYSGSSPIGYYLDSVPFGFVRSAIAPDPDVYDLDRVEVLRGPQGTLYGASAQGGVVRVLTHDADLNEFGLKARSSASSTEDGGENYRGDLAINVPIVEGKLAARGVVGYKKLGGWIDKPGRADANDTEMVTTRVKLNAQLTERMSLGVSGWISRSDIGAPPLSDDNHESPALDIESVRNNFDIYSLKIGYDFSSFSLTSSTSYLDFFNDGDLALAPGLDLVIATDYSAQTFAEEINLASTHEGPWRWVAGAIYRDSQDRRPQDLSSLGLAFPQTVKLNSRSWAAFGELTHSFLNGQLEFTAGLRHFEDDVGMREESRLGNIPLADPISRNSKFNATTPRLILTWKPEDRMMVYASYSEGFRSGFDQIPSLLLGAPSLGPVHPDLLKNYELGAKGSLWNGRVDFDSAAYFLDWQDVQLPIVTLVDGVGFGTILNGESASGVGVDFTLTVKPAAGLVLGVNSSWNDLTVDEDVFSSGVLLFGKGDRLNYSSEYTIGASADYDFALGSRGLRGRLSSSAKYTSPRTFKALVGDGVFASSGDSLTVGRVSFAVASPDSWTMSLFADNITNEGGSVSGTLGLTQPWWATRMRPRTVGLQVEYRY